MQRLKGVANGASTEMAGALETAHTESKKSSEALQGDRSEIEVKGVGNLEAMYSLAFTFAFAGYVHCSGGESVHCASVVARRKGTAQGRGTKARHKGVAQARAQGRGCGAGGGRGGRVAAALS
mmetsp:Transcript_100374/g.287233  ORF Transcript_100374/g.287233 Transcript_100374/m.287233 type:complete len:123 (+) Transcript_100374:97-465(+)